MTGWKIASPRWALARKNPISPRRVRVSSNASTRLSTQQR